MFLSLWGILAILLALWYFRPTLAPIAIRIPEIELSPEVQPWFIKGSVVHHSPTEVRVQFEIRPDYLATLSRKHRFPLSYRLTTLPHSERVAETSCEIGPDDKIVEVSIRNPERLAIRKIRFLIGH